MGRPPKSGKKGTSKGSVVHRPDPGSITAKDFAIKEIALLMTTKTWHPYKSVNEYAATSGLAPTTVADYAKDAARLIRLAWGDEATKTIVTENIARLGEEAANRTEEVLDKEGNVKTVRKPDYKSAIHAQEVLASILGMTRQQHELKLTYERMTDDQLMGEAVKFIEQQQSRALPMVTETRSHERSSEGTEIQDADFEVSGPIGGDPVRD